MNVLIAKHIESIFLNFDFFLINIENHENSANESKIYILSFLLLFFCFLFGFLKGKKKDRKMGYDKSYQKIFITLHNCQYYLIKKLFSQLYA